MGMGPAHIMSHRCFDSHASLNGDASILSIITTVKGGGYEGIMRHTVG